jgi:tRNA A37 threonylcarbamoyladenosine biosynthesis protein TsaE
MLFKRILDFVNPQVEEDEPIIHASDMYKISDTANKQINNEAQKWAEKEIKNIEQQMITAAKMGRYSLSIEMKEPQEKIRALKKILEDKGYRVTQYFSTITIKWYEGPPSSRVLDCPTPPPPPKPR